MPIRWHELKSWPVFYQAVIDGIKPFEVRFNDRDFRVGDGLCLREWNPDTSAYSGRSTRCCVTYVLCRADHAGVAQGFVVMGIAPSFPEQEGGGR